MVFNTLSAAEMIIHMQKCEDLRISTWHQWNQEKPSWRGIGGGYSVAADTKYEAEVMVINKILNKETDNV